MNAGWKTDVLLSGTWRSATSVLLSNGRHRIVVDTGLPHEAPVLINALKQRGLQPADIQTLFNTHFHIDHVLNNSLFTNATIYGSQKSYDWCCSLYADLQDDLGWEKLVLKYYPETFDYDRAKELMGTLRKLALRWWDVARLGSPERFRWVESCPLPEGIEKAVTSGHVPGHVSLIVHDTVEPTVIAGDALLSRLPDERVLTMIPHNREQSLLDRSMILSMTGRILPGHDNEFTTPEAPSR